MDDNGMQQAIQGLEQGNSQAISELGNQATMPQLTLDPFAAAPSAPAPQLTLEQSMGAAPTPQLTLGQTAPALQQRMPHRRRCHSFPLKSERWLRISQHR